MTAADFGTPIDVRRATASAPPTDALGLTIAVTRAMARAGGPAPAIAALLATLGRELGWGLCAYWETGDDDALHRTGCWRGDERIAPEFEARSQDRALAIGEGFAGWIAAGATAVWLTDTGAEGGAPAAALAGVGVAAAAGIPVMRGGEAVGVVELLGDRPRPREEALAAALGGVGEQIGELLGVLEDRDTLLSRLEHLALTDQVTGLPNRRAWEQSLARELARAGRDSHPVCVAVLDLDGFKHYNDGHGHPSGDALLHATAEAWIAQLRGGDLIARYGGDEFAAIIPAGPLDQAVAVVERLRDAVPGGQTCSAGVACWDAAESGAELFARADAALYAAKQRGRDRTVAATR